MRTLPAFAVILGLVAGSARAETAASALMAASLKAAPKGVALDFPTPNGGLALRYADARQPRTPGVAKTSIDRKFRDNGVVGSLGFLCGLEPGAAGKGAAEARGYDPTGRFVGAKLRVAFR